MRECVKPGCDRALPEDAPENRVYCSSRCRTAHWRLKQETPRRVKPSGRQVSYRKAVKALAVIPIEQGWTSDPARAEAWIERYLSRALPERQRTPR